MIKYKRIYPLKQNGRLAAIVTVVGDNISSEVFVKFKIPPKETGLMLILFNPKTYEYEMLPLDNKMTINRCLTDMTACIIACKNGMFIEFLMEGSINKSHINTSKLKSMIAMDMYASNNYASEETPNGAGANTENIGTDNSCEDSVFKDSICEDSVENDNKNDQCKTSSYNEHEQQAITFDSEDNKELMDYLKQMEGGKLPFSYALKGAEKSQCAEKEPGATGSGACCGEISSYNIHVPNAEKINIPKMAEEASGKYCEFVNPFKERWNGVWWKVQYPDKSWHYIVGRVQVDGANVSVLGVPGERSQKPVCLENCDMYAVADNGVGYWLMFQK